MCIRDRIQEGQELTLVRLNNYWYLDQGTYAPATPTPQPTVPTPRVPLDSPSSSDGSVAPYLKKQPEPTLMIGAGIAGAVSYTHLDVYKRQG